MADEMRLLREQGVDETLIRGVEQFRGCYPVDEEEKGRVAPPLLPFY